MTIAFNRAIAIVLQIPYSQYEDYSELKAELADLDKEMTRYEMALMCRIRYIAEEVAKKNEKPPSPKVYFAKASGGPVKIGYTEGSLKTRVSALRNGSHEKIEMQAAIHGAGLKIESELHDKFNMDRLNGEWFKESPELREIMDRHPVSETPPDPPCQCDICKKLPKPPVPDQIPF